MSRALALLLAGLLLAACPSTRKEPEPPPPTSGEKLAIETREIAPTTVLALPLTGPYAEAERHFEAFAANLLASGVAPVGDLMGVFFDDPSTVPPDRTRYEIRIPVPAGTTAKEPYRVYGEDGFRAAAARLVGPYPVISRRYGEIYAWIEENGLTPDGPLIEVYVKHAGSGVPPEEYVTEVLVPVRPTGK